MGLFSTIGSVAGAVFGGPAGGALGNAVGGLLDGGNDAPGGGGGVNPTAGNYDDLKQIIQENNAESLAFQAFMTQETQKFQTQSKAFTQIAAAVEAATNIVNQQSQQISQ